MREKPNFDFNFFAFHVRLVFLLDLFSFAPIKM